MLICSAVEISKINVIANHRLLIPSPFFNIIFQHFMIQKVRERYKGTNKVSRKSSLHKKLDLYVGNPRDLSKLFLRTHRED